MLTALRYPAYAGQQRRLLGHGTGNPLLNSLLSLESSTGPTGDTSHGKLKTRRHGGRDCDCLGTKGETKGVRPVATSF